jgi:Domain of unknown function (DUF3303)/Putative zinc-finger
MTCEELEELSGAYALDAVTPAEREAAQAHLALCAACTRRLQELRAVVDLLPYSAPQVNPPESLKKRVFDAIHKENYMLFMVIERYKNRNAKAVYLRAKEQGRILPDGLTYMGSWVEDNFDRCFQLMECEDPQLFQQWTVHWEDLVAFEIVHVVTSEEAREAALSGRSLAPIDDDSF